MTADSASADPRIRTATAADLDQVLAMDRGARSLLTDQRGGPEWLTEHPSLSEMDPHEVVAHAVVAEYAGAVVGFLTYRFETRPGRGRICCIDRVFVEEAAREHGCGDGLLALATEIARGSGCTAIEGNALPGDRDTKNLYERARMKARSIVTATDL